MSRPPIPGPIQVVLVPALVVVVRRPEEQRRKRAPMDVPLPDR